jgi:hypothetical protein
MVACCSLPHRFCVGYALAMAEMKVRERGMPHTGAGWGWGLTVYCEKDCRTRRLQRQCNKKQHSHEHYTSTIHSVLHACAVSLFTYGMLAGIPSACTCHAVHAPAMSFVMLFVDVRCIWLLGLCWQAGKPLICTCKHWLGKPWLLTCSHT